MRSKPADAQYRTGIPGTPESVIPGCRSFVVRMHVAECAWGMVMVDSSAHIRAYSHLRTSIHCFQPLHGLRVGQGFSSSGVEDHHQSQHRLLHPITTALTILHRLQSSEEHSDILINLEAAQKHLDFLTSGFLHALDALPPSVSDTLQTAPPPQQTQQQARSLSALASASAPAAAEAQKEKKVRMKRVPKGVVPGVTPPPDPERWLKKSERTVFGQGNRRRKGGGGATQGAMEPAGGGGQKTGGGKGKKKR